MEFLETTRENGKAMLKAEELFERAEEYQRESILNPDF
jgi:hypothetical protein